MRWTTRIANWFAYVWCAVLLVQNAAIVTTVMQMRSPEATSYLWWAAARMLVVCLAMLGFIRHRGRATLLALAAAIVLAFPISLIAEQALDGATPPLAMFLYLSALISYAATGALLVANRGLLARKTAVSAIPPS